MSRTGTAIKGASGLCFRKRSIDSDHFKGNGSAIPASARIPPITMDSPPKTYSPIKKWKARGSFSRPGR